MITCEVCGGVKFEKYAGFMYCVVCQTQSQDFHEQEYEYNATDRIRRQKTRTTESKKKEKTQDDGVWTSWEAFNYILYGMTQELMKAFPLPDQFQSLVLKLWACYLQKCQAAFISLHNEAFPKLQYNFKSRDARVGLLSVLYNLDVDKYSSKRSQRSKSVCSMTSNTSLLSSKPESRRSQAKRRSKVVASEYKELWNSSSATTAADLNNETLETLGRSRLSEMETDEETDTEEIFQKCFKEIFGEKELRTHKSVINKTRTRLNAKDQAKKSVKYLAKNKLLSILHLALLMTRSEVQLSDTMRLIRESHLSYSKVSHFLPKDVKFSKNDATYIEVISDQLMPTHLSQRKITNQMAYLLQIDKIRVPNMSALVRRYCQDLNLPEQVHKLSEKILANWVPEFTVPRSRSLFPSYEAWAMASIIVVMKLLFGVDDKTELFLSDLAISVNKIHSSDCNSTHRKRLFVFEDWQKFIECRKSVLIEFHYPTHEQLDGDAIVSSKMFLHKLVEESKDEYRAERFIPYSSYYIDSNLMKSIKDVVNTLNEPIEYEAVEFKASLTPQNSHLTMILAVSKAVSDASKAKEENDRKELPEEILRQSFYECSVNFVYELDKYLNLISTQGGESTTRLRFYTGLPKSGKNSNPDEFKVCPKPTYWTLHCAKSSSLKLINFKNEILRKTPDNFQWLIGECARMLEMNVRDLYNEVVSVEKFLSNKGEIKNAYLFV